MACVAVASIAVLAWWLLQSVVEEPPSDTGETASAAEAINSDHDRAAPGEVEGVDPRPFTADPADSPTPTPATSPALIRVRVVDHADRPVPGIVLSMRMPNTFRRERTGTDGIARFPVPRDAFVTNDGLVVTTTDCRALPAPSVRCGRESLDGPPATLALPPLGTVIVHLLNPDGSPMLRRGTVALLPKDVALREAWPWHTGRKRFGQVDALQRRRYSRGFGARTDA